MKYEEAEFPAALIARYHNPVLTLKLETALAETIVLATEALSLPKSGNVNAALIKARLAKITEDLLTIKDAPKRTGYDPQAIPTNPARHTRPWL